MICYDAHADCSGKNTFYGQQGFVVANEAVSIPVDDGGYQTDGAAVVTDFRLKVLVKHFLNDAGVFGETFFNGGSSSASTAASSMGD